MILVGELFKKQYAFMLNSMEILSEVHQILCILKQVDRFKMDKQVDRFNMDKQEYMMVVVE